MEVDKWWDGYWHIVTCLWIFFVSFFYWTVFTELRRDTEKDFHLLGLSPCGCKSWSWARSAFLVSHWGQGPKHCKDPPLYFWATSRSWRELEQSRHELAPIWNPGHLEVEDDTENVLWRCQVKKWFLVTSNSLSRQFYDVM